jgi:ATP/maltotriose-dependent transcriptional regulator MalT
LRDDLERYIAEQTQAVAAVDYFATSLPTMLLFTVDTQAIHETRVLVLRAQLALLDGDTEGAADLARRVLARDPLNPHARTAASPNTPTPTPSLLKGAT